VVLAGADALVKRLCGRVVLDQRADGSAVRTQQSWPFHRAFTSSSRLSRTYTSDESWVTSRSAGKHHGPFGINIRLRCARKLRRGPGSGPVGLEEAEPDFADGREAGDGVPQPADRDLAGHGDGGRMDQLLHAGADEGDTEHRCGTSRRAGPPCSACSGRPS